MSMGAVTGAARPAPVAAAAVRVAAGFAVGCWAWSAVAAAMVSGQIERSAKRVRLFSITRPLIMKSRGRDTNTIAEALGPHAQRRVRGDERPAGARGRGLPAESRTAS